MEVGAEYSKRQLHGKKYFTELMGRLDEVPESVKARWRCSRRRNGNCWTVCKKSLC
jgi:transposase